MTESVPITILSTVWRRVGAPLAASLRGAGSETSPAFLIARISGLYRSRAAPPLKSALKKLNGRSILGISFRTKSTVTGI